VRSEMGCVYVREEGHMSYRLCRFHCQMADWRSKDFTLSSNGDLGGDER